jgi:hypothetical protein
MISSNQFPIVDYLLALQLYVTHQSLTASSGKTSIETASQRQKETAFISKMKRSQGKPKNPTNPMNPNEPLKRQNPTSPQRANEQCSQGTVYSEPNAALRNVSLVPGFLR